jgi:hypothetical protein
VNESQGAGWASYRIARYTLFATAFFSALAAFLSYCSLQIAQRQLTIDQQPMAVVDCSFPERSAKADYVAFLDRATIYGVVFAVGPSFKIEQVSPYMSYSDCQVRNYGKYPLMDLSFDLDVNLSPAYGAHQSNIVRHVTNRITIEGVPAGGAEHVFVVNRDACNVASISVEPELTFLNAPYVKATVFSQPGRRESPEQRYELNAVAYPPRVRRALEHIKLIPVCPGH